MANFFIIDHSLKDTGGHHLDYARCIANAAVSSGYNTIVGTHRRFRPHWWKRQGNVTGADRCQLVPVFRKTTYQPDSYLAGLQHLTRSQSNQALCLEANATWWQKTRHRAHYLLHHRRREWFVRQFAADCFRMFANFRHREGDHAFLTTVSELELMGLAIYLSNQPQTLQTQWHIQFHFNLFEGRTPEYASQGHIAEAVNACFVASLSRLCYHSLHFYTTSQTLADQYNRLGVAEFHPLPYPVAESFLPSAELPLHIAAASKELRVVTAETDASVAWQRSDPPTNSPSLQGAESSETLRKYSAPRLANFGPAPDSQEFHRPLRLTCAGAIRREKGQAHYLQDLVDQIWDKQLNSGNVQLVIQRPEAKWPAKKSKLELVQPESAIATESVHPPIDYVVHPLPHQQYVDLIRSTDIGLLCYDSRVYYSRRAGVLGELLACGKPVIVSSGSWLADQIQEPNQQYIESLLREYPTNRRLTIEDLRWNRRNMPLPGGVVSFDQMRHPFQFDIQTEANETAVLIGFRWHWPRDAGTYCRIELSEWDDDDQLVRRSSRVVGHRCREATVRALFPVDGQTHRVHVSLSNAFDSSTASVKQLSIDLLEVDPAMALPTSSVGLIASDPADIARCVDEMVHYYDHYRQSAESFSSVWASRHDPQLTLDHLLSVEQSLRHVA